MSFCPQIAQIFADFSERPRSVLAKLRFVQRGRLAWLPFAKQSFEDKCVPNQEIGNEETSSSEICVICAICG